jgi:hypothetical protein
MAIRIVRHAEEHSAEVARLNERLRAGGEQSQFPVSPVPSWLPPAPGRTIYQEHFLAVDQDGAVRGAYTLKHQDFQIGGEVVSIGDLELPISEGAVNRTYANLAAMLLLDARRRKPLIYGLGMGGRQTAVARLFAAAGWMMHVVGFFFKVVHPVAFLRKLPMLRWPPAKRLLSDVAAFSGLGWLGVHSIQWARSRRVAARAALSVEQVDEFGPWADALWAACRGDYGMIAVRNAEVLRILYPKEDPRFLRLRVCEGGEPIGWSVVLDTPMRGHKQFGWLRVGSVVDGLARAADAAKVVALSTGYLQERGVDLIVTNQSHAAWGAAFDAAGYLRGPSNFVLAASQDLAKRLEACGVPPEGIYITRGDGDGPIHL